MDPTYFTWTGGQDFEVEHVAKLDYGAFGEVHKVGHLKNKEANWR